MPKKKRVRRGEGTPIRDFKEPILMVLERMGGRGQGRDVVKEVGRIMGTRLENEADQELLADGSPRWMNRCHWARRTLREERKIRGNSPRLTWELR